VKIRDFLDENCAKCRELVCSSLVELVQGVGEWVTCCGHCVSSTRICV